MHLDQPATPPATTNGRPWWRELTRYHWFVFVVAALGWLFDTMDQQLFTLARTPAITDVLSREPELAAMRAGIVTIAPDGLGSPAGGAAGLAVAVARAQVPSAEIRPVRNRVDGYAGYATAIFLIGWATGGVAFGVLGDRIGRARTMVLTILVYSICTGLSALSWDFWSFAFFRFLTGLGVGGEFAVGVALLAEVMPDRARPFAIGWLQSLSAVGNITAAVLSILVPDWRVLFLIGTGPALMALLIRRRLKEPERWQAVAVSEGVDKQLGSYRELFGDPRWRHNALAGLGLAFAGVVGLWGIGFFSFELLRSVLEPVYEKQGLDAATITRKLALWVGIQSILQNAGGFVGIQAYMWLTHWTTRRFAFLVSFIAALISTAFTFALLGKVAPQLGLSPVWDIFWMIPIMGCCQLALFGGYAIYFPELFPTRLRSTGTSFCYNVGRFVAALGPFTFGVLVSRVYSGPDAMRYGGVTMCAFFLVGLIALPFAPETKGKPLPE